MYILHYGQTLRVIARLSALGSTLKHVVVMPSYTWRIEHGRETSARRHLFLRYSLISVGNRFTNDELAELALGQYDLDTGMEELT